jgi:hypothetical protein
MAVPSSDTFDTACKKSRKGRKIWSSIKKLRRKTPGREEGGRPGRVTS